MDYRKNKVWKSINRPDMFVNTNAYFQNSLQLRLSNSDIATEYRASVYAATGNDVCRPGCDPAVEMANTNAALRVLIDELDDPDSKYYKYLQEELESDDEYVHLDMLYNHDDYKNRKAALLEMTLLDQYTKPNERGSYEYHRNIYKEKFDMYYDTYMNEEFVE